MAETRFVEVKRLFLPIWLFPVSISLYLYQFCSFSTNRFKSIFIFYYKKTHQWLPEQVQEVDVIDEIQADSRGQIADVHLTVAHDRGVVEGFQEEDEDQHGQGESQLEGEVVE